MRRKKKKDNINFDRRLNGHFGVFSNNSDNPVFYINTSLPIEKITYIEPVREVLNINEVDFDELVQRNLDDVRIKNDIAPYLLSDQGYKFFPPIVSAFIQKQDNAEALKEKYPNLKAYLSNEDEKLNLEFSEGFSFSFWINEFNENQLDYDGCEVKWNGSNTKLMAVDGQHRLVALQAVSNKFSSSNIELKEFYDSVRSNAEKVKNILVPNTLLFFPLATEEIDKDSLQLLNRFFPFVEWPEKSNGRKVKDILREIFVDVNKNARTPTISRNILLDEKDLCAIFSRKVFSAIREVDKDIYPIILEFDSPKGKEDQIERGRPTITTIKIVNDALEHLFREHPQDRRKTDTGLNLRNYIIPKSYSNSFEDVTPTNFEYNQRQKLEEWFKDTWCYVFRDFYVELEPFVLLKKHVQDEYENYLNKKETEYSEEEIEKKLNTVHEIIFGGSEKRFFYEENAKGGSTNSKLAIRKLKEKEGFLSEPRDEFSQFYTKMFQIAYFKVIREIISRSEKLAPSLDKRISRDESSSIIEILNNYISDNKGTKSIFHEQNRLNKRIIYGGPKPKHIKNCQNLISLVILGYEDLFVQKIKDVNQEKLMESIDKAKENIIESAEKNLKQEFKNTPEGENLLEKIEEALVEEDFEAKEKLENKFVADEALYIQTEKKHLNSILSKFGVLN